MLFFRRTPSYDPGLAMDARLRFLLWTSGWRGALVLGIALLLGLALWRGPEAYRALKERHAAGLLAEAETARAHSDFLTESRKLQQAAALLPRHPLVLRAQAGHQLAHRNLAALETYARLLATGLATPADQLASARAAFRLGRPERAAAAIESLRAAGSEWAAAARSLEAEMLAWQGRRPEALAAAREAVAADPHTPASRWLLARLLIQESSGNPAAGAEGVDLLDGLVRGADEIALEALQWLIELALQPRTAGLLKGRPATDWVAAARQQPGADPALQVQAWSLLLAAEPERRAAIVAEFIDCYQDEREPERRLEAARWLRQQGARDAVQQMARTSRMESEEWFMLHLDSLASAGDWQEVRRQLSEATATPLSTAPRLLFLLRARLETGLQVDVTEAWAEIHRAARLESSRTQLYLAGYAEQIGFAKEALLIYRRLVEVDAREVSTDVKFGRLQRQACYLGALRTGAANLPLAELADFMKRFADEFPELDEVANDSAYLQLLLGRATPEVEATARRLATKRPELLAYRTTLALCHLVQGQPAAAGAVYDGWTIDWSTAPDRYKVVRLAVLRALGKTRETTELATRLNPQQLRAEELRLAGLDTAGRN